MTRTENTDVQPDVLEVRMRPRRARAGKVMQVGCESKDSRPKLVDDRAKERPDERRMA